MALEQTRLFFHNIPAGDFLLNEIECAILEDVPIYSCKHTCSFFWEARIDEAWTGCYSQ